jgi:hypothetical protein
MGATELEGLSPADQAKEAIRHVLCAIRDDPHKSYLMGIGTGSYHKLTEAWASLTGQSLTEVREGFLHPEPKNPRDDAAELKAEELHPFIAELIDDSDIADYLADRAPIERMIALGEILDRFCPRCGGDCVINARKCGCRRIERCHRQERWAS